MPTGRKTKAEEKKIRHEARVEYNKRLAKVQTREKNGRYSHIKKGEKSPTFPVELYWQAHVKWTIDYVNEELDMVLDKLLSDPMIITYKDLFETRPYTTQSFNYYVNKFGHQDSPEFDPALHEKVVKIKEILENRLVDAGLHYKTQPIFTIFLLKNKYEGYEDKKVVEHDHKITAISEGKKAMMIEMKKKLKLKAPTVEYEMDYAE